MSGDKIKPQAEDKGLDNKKLLELRRIRGISIIAKGDTPEIIDSEQFVVPSQSSDKKYRVTHKEIWQCECPDFQTRHLECKHIQAIKFFLKLRTSQEPDVLDWNSGIEQDEKVCPNCKSKEITKQGVRKTISGNRQKYRCQECKKYFVLEPIKYTKINAKMVTLVMDLYFKGNSLRDIQDTIKQFYNIEIHHETIRRYILKFTKVINKYTDGMKPKLSNKIHVDEQKVRTKHNEMVWSWNAIDHDTRFLIANNITKERNIEDAQQIMQKVKDVAGKSDLTITTDKLSSYPHAIGQTFHKINEWEYNQNAVKHIAKAGINNVHKNNNMIERYHNEFREFDKVRRGIDNVEQWSAGFRLYHNYIKENSALGETPSERAGIYLNSNNNRWLSLLKKSLQN